MTLQGKTLEIWTRMGLGPTWQLRQPLQDAGSQVPDEACADAPELAGAVTLSDSIAWVGDFDLVGDGQGRQWPAGPAGDLLCNMVRAAGFAVDAQAWVSTREGFEASTGLKRRLAATGCAYAVLLGDAADLAAARLSSPGAADPHGVFELDCQTHAVTCRVMDPLAALLAAPQRKAQAWAALCFIRDRFVPRR